MEKQQAGRQETPGLPVRRESVAPPGRGAWRGGIEERGRPVCAHALAPYGNSKPAGEACQGFTGSFPPRLRAFGLQGGFSDGDFTSSLHTLLTGQCPPP